MEQLALKTVRTVDDSSQRVHKSAQMANHLKDCSHVNFGGMPFRQMENVSRLR
jgi:hypothetical protein